MFISVTTPVPRGDRGEVGPACGCGAALENLRASVADLTLEVRRLGAPAARRRTPRSRDARDELLVLLLTSVFGDDAIQVVDVMARAAHSAELRQALDHAGAESGRKLGRWFERVASCDTRGAQ